MKRKTEKKNRFSSESTIRPGKITSNHTGKKKRGPWRRNRGAKKQENWKGGFPQDEGVRMYQMGGAPKHRAMPPKKTPKLWKKQVT